MEWRIIVHMTNGQEIGGHWREGTIDDIVKERAAITAAMVYGSGTTYEFTDCYTSGSGVDVTREHYIQIMEINEIVLETGSPAPDRCDATRNYHSSPHRGCVLR